MSDKLLTIAIPTWNRASIISESLSCLLPQIIEHKEDIQLIISDNASDDNSVSLINELLTTYNGIDVVFYQQSENTGYYGNFRKCRELASGNYFWLLSDNEVILNGLLAYIVSLLKKFPETGIIYLNNLLSGGELDFRNISFDELFFERNYKLTFISACIMRNRKDRDEMIFKEFYGNSFLGYALLLNNRKYSGSALEITGKIYRSIPTVVSFNVFKSWTKDIFQCFAFIERENLFHNHAVERMKECIIKFVMKDHVIHYKMYGSYYGKDFGTFDENYALLLEYYGNVMYFNEITQIKETPRSILFFRRFRNKVLNKFRKLMLKH